MKTMKYISLRVLAIAALALISLTNILIKNRYENNEIYFS